MDKVPGAAIFMFLCLSITIGDGGQQHFESQSKKQASFWERLRSTYSTPSTVSSPTPTTTGRWRKIKTLVNQAHARLFPPNLDFTRGDEDGGAGEKVKEALAKSLGKSKATVEDSAKSAATIAGETVQKTKETVKKSLLERKREHQNEL